MSVTLLTFEAIRARLVADSGLVTASGSSTTTTGGITAGQNSLVVASASTFSVGHGICVAGAGTGGGNLITWITAISGSTLVLFAKAVTTVVGAVVSHDDRAVVAASAIIPQYGSKPVVFPCIGIRMDGAIGNDFANTLAGKLYIGAYVQSERGQTGQPATVLNLICDRIRELLHRHETDLSNSALNVDVMIERFKTGVMPEVEISETTHSQTMTYDYMSQLL
jgi:hypothetical protein